MSGSKEAASAAAALVQKAADDAAYASKIQSAISAKRWIDVPFALLPPEAIAPDGRVMPIGMVVSDLAAAASLDQKT